MCRSRRELSNEYLLAKFGFDKPRTRLVKFARSARTDPPGAFPGFATSMIVRFNILETDRKNYRRTESATDGNRRFASSLQLNLEAARRKPAERRAILWTTMW